MRPHSHQVVNLPAVYAAWLSTLLALGDLVSQPLQILKACWQRQMLQQQCMSADPLVSLQVVPEGVLQHLRRFEVFFLHPRVCVPLMVPLLQPELAHLDACQRHEYYVLLLDVLAGFEDWIGVAYSAPAEEDNL